LIYCKKADCLNVYYPSSVVKYREISNEYAKLVRI